MFQGNDGLDSVTVNKDDLLAHLHANREKHELEYWEAIDGWMIECTSYADRLVKVVTDWVAGTEGGRERALAWKHENPPQRPVNHLKTYDRVILMAQSSVKDEITLDSQSFAQYYMDDWSWKAGFSASNASYIATASRHK